jgi:hypothetical protein
MAGGSFNERNSTASDRSILTEGDWHGWVWLGKRWLRVCATDGLGATSALLSKEATARGVRDAATCLTRGGAPTWSPAERIRRAEG